MKWYILISTIILFLLGITWSKKKWYNIIIKYILLIISIFGTLYSLKAFGYIFKIN